MELEDLFHRFPQSRIIMLHCKLESDRGKISESSFFTRQTLAFLNHM